MRGSAVFRTGVAPGGALAGPWVRDPLWTRARAVPSLDLRFADNKSLVDAVTGASLVTFTRASTGTFVGSDGVLRSAVTNLLLRSEEFDNAAWVKSGATVSVDQIASPIGLVNADKLVEGTNTGTHNASQTVTVVSGATYVYSTYIKAGERTFVGVYAGNPSQGIIINLSNGAFAGNLISAPTSYTIIPAGNGWYRASITYTASSTLTAPGVYVCNASAAFSYTGDNTSGIYAWGAQLEQSATVGEYIPTTSAINSAPRFDHNPTTGESLGLMVEEARTNLVLRSEEFDNASWAKVRSTVTANAIIAPDGASTADFIQQSAGQTNAGVVTVTAVVTTPVLSIFAKAGTKSRISLLTDASGNSETWFDLANGTVGTKGSNHAANIVNFGNGWHRCSVASTVISAFASIYLADTNGSRVVTDSGGVYLWGAQLEAGALATSYIPTTTATVTRAADVASITGTNFSSWYNQTEGTVFTEYRDPGVSGTNRTPFAISDGTGNNRIQFFVNGTTTVNNRHVAAGVASNPGTLSAVLNSRNRHAIASAVGSCNAASNGTLATASTPITMPVVNRLNIGINGDGTGDYLNAPVARITFWPTRLSNTTLQAISQP